MIGLDVNLFFSNGAGSALCWIYRIIADIRQRIRNSLMLFFQDAVCFEQVLGRQYQPSLERAKHDGGYQHRYQTHRACLGIDPSA